MGTISLLSADYNLGTLAVGKECKISHLWIHTELHCFVLIFNSLIPNTSFSTGSVGGIPGQYNSYKLSSLIKDKPK